MRSIRSLLFIGLAADSLAEKPSGNGAGSSPRERDNLGGLFG